MSSLRAPHLGPIVGHTTSTSARLWIRGAGVDRDGARTDENRRTVGVIALFEENGRRLRSKPAYYFRLRREYDRTGTFTLGEEVGITASRSAEPRLLQPDTEYVARMGTLTVDDAAPDGESLSNSELARRLPDPGTWINDLEQLPADQSEARFRTFTDSGDSCESDFSFLLGSCRYPGLLWKRKHADAIFGPFLAESQGRDGRQAAKCALMVGDQIYADMLNRHVPVGLADTFEEFQERYHSAFGSTKMRKLLRHLPTYMILDDHEIEDNWSQDRIRKSKSRRIFNMAIDAYRSYQWVHGPGGFGQRLFYTFACSGYPFFVLDTRTQRFMDDTANSLHDNHMLGRPSLSEEEPSQLDLLIEWLTQCQANNGDRPKFIVSSSVFAPSPVDARTGRKGDPSQEVKWKENSDSWPAFPRTRTAILKTIVEQRIQNVIFLSGDIHCANVAKMQFSGSREAEAIRAFSITSSALYWPFPFADGEPSNFVHDSTASGQEDTFGFDANGQTHEMNYTAWNFTQEDNFCRVDLNRDSAQIVVTPFGTDGEVIEKGGGWFGRDSTPIQSSLDLARW